jgi:glycosyltransferase involved in cell wall biosynthesis
MRILLIAAWFPAPPSNGSRLRVHQLLRALTPRHEVTFLGFADQPDVDPAALRGVCRAAQVLPRPAFRPATWRSRLAWLDRRPRSLALTFSPAMATAIATAARDCDVVVASQLSCAAYWQWFGDAPALAEEIELGALHGQLADGSPAARWRARLMWGKYARLLRRMLPRFGACTVVSEPERALLARVLGHSRAIHVLPNGVHAGEYATAPSAPAETVIFTGALRYAPNHQGMQWFIAEVWPRVRSARPAARLLITGDHGGLALPAGDGIERTGFVDDVRPLLAGAAAAVAPIFAGGGTRVKILEAMASGTAVVATQKGAEGLDAGDGEHLLIGDDAATFAAHVVSVLSDDALRMRLARAARRLIEERYDWDVIGPRFAALVETVAGAGRRAAAPA